MINALLQLLAPVRCVYCSAPKTLLCESHRQSEPPRSDSLERLSGLYATELDPALLAAFSAFKDRSITALAPILAELVSPLLATELWGQAQVVVIPPSTAKAYRTRGFVPVRQILHHCKLQAPVVSLTLARKTMDQRKLTALQRSQNLDGAFRSPALSGKRVLLFDDVLTTGATIREMQRAVEFAGGEVLGFCVLARRFVDSTNQASFKA